MKKIFSKKLILGYILGILTSGFAVYAYVVGAGDVSYSPTNPAFNVNNVSSALNTLYDRSGNIADRVDGTHSSAVYQGKRIYGTGATLNLTEGDYYVFLVYSRSWNGGRDYINYSNELNFADYVPQSFEFINVDYEVLKTQINGESGETKINNSNSLLLMTRAVLKCKVKNNGGVIKSKYGDSTGENTYSPIVLTIDAVKID